MPNTAETVALKAEARAVAAAARKVAHAAKPDAGEVAASRFLGAFMPPAGATVSIFWPIRDEIDTRPLLHHLHAAGMRCCLPVVVGRGQPLIFRPWTPATVLEEGNFRTLAPPPSAGEVEPDVLVAPLLAFDRAGYRLGYGGGFYDRTLAKLRATGPRRAIGFAFAAQEVPAVPRDETDARLDGIVTEGYVLTFD